jgi:putative peptide zinc metalloprotease protein
VEAATGTVAPPALNPAGRRQSDYPHRAEGLELLGEMPGSGYRQAPALARRRDGQVIKLTGLLYQLIESIDGRRDYDELAAELSRRASKRATARDVEYLVEHKLRPLGVLREADGAQPEVSKANPLLALRLRAILSKPQLTRLITAPFTWLFSPVVMIPVVAGFALLCWWLITDMGLSAPLHQAFYEPAMILVVWALIIVGAAFHEIGHAAACRYGGARPGVMGAGLYLVWPVFYTEVSDAYRLDRRSRLRVDLGGLYFNAIFALAIAGIWAATGADAVLLVIAILLAQMVRQLAPFIRADGYHILSDLVGVPDLFAHIKPTLLGLLPTRWGQGGQHRLKPWARALVSAWVLVVAPLLAAMLAYFVLILPRLAATAWDSMRLEWAAATESWTNGDPAAVVVSMVSTGLVALPVLGIGYLLWLVARRAAKWTWSRTAERPVLRALSALAAVGLAALVAWAWWPSGDRYQPIRADESGPVPAVAPDITTAAPSLEFLSATQPPPSAGADAIDAGPPQSSSVTHSLQPPDANPRFGDVPARAISQPAQTDPSEQSSWPFPFDPPDPPGPGDNQALAVNTLDNSVVWDVAMSLLVLTQGDPVDQANEAYALASCKACTTVAVAFQVIVIVGYVDEITPENTAVAVNYDCHTCTTAAFAYQLVVTALEAPSPELVQQLSTILQRLQELEANRESLTIEQIYLALEDIEEDLLKALVESGADTDAVAPQADGDAGETADEAPTDTPALPTDTPPASEQPSSSSSGPAPSDQPTAETTPTETTPAPSATECPTSTDPSSDPSCTSTTETTTTPEPAPTP